MKYIIFALGFAISLNATNIKTNNDLSWSTPKRGTYKYVPIKVQKKYTLKGSKIFLSMKEINNQFNAPEWFKTKIKMPNIVKYGKAPKVWACASCHLSSGMGHPESARLAGLTSQYLQAQLRAFATKKRIDYSGHMNEMAANLTKAEIKEASDWFGALTPHKEYKVIESARVPKTIIDDSRMRIKVEYSNKKNNKAGLEDIKNRVIEIPKNIATVKLRSPNAGFIAYVKPGSIKAGELKATLCKACHGVNLKGTTIAPNIAGLSPMYVIRQLHGFKNKTRAGVNADKNSMMSGLSKSLSDDDIYNLAAFVATLNP